MNTKSKVLTAALMGLGALTMAMPAMAEVTSGDHMAAATTTSGKEVVKKAHVKHHAKAHKAMKDAKETSAK